MSAKATFPAATDLTLEVAGERVVLMPERAVLRQGEAGPTLLLADVHLGKCEAMRVQGAPLPDGVIEADLQRLTLAIERSGATRLVVVGDLLHAAAGVTDHLHERVIEWRRGRLMSKIEIAIVPGNHDRALAAAAHRWGMRVLPSTFVDSGVRCVHDPAHATNEPGVFAWCGHVHPAFVLRARGDALKLPCFWIGATIGVLPAFSLFTAGASIRPVSGDRVIAVAAGRLVDCAQALRERS